MQRLVIVGTGGQSIDILDAVEAMNAVRPTYEIAGFLDDNADLRGKKVFGLPVLGPLSEGAKLPADTQFSFGIGHFGLFPRRKEIIAGIGVSDERFAKIIHPSAAVSPRCTLGSGAVVLANVTIAAQAEIGKHVMILPGAVISHHDRIGDYCILTGGVAIAGRVTIGERTYIGTNAAIREDSKIGSGCTVGMGTVVLGDVAEGQVVVGNPARPLSAVS
jgi:sugar O-acyltransferase (sialic acid O-acetyltransferase NeuD family)